jgi:hypothetical protein
MLNDVRDGICRRNSIPPKQGMDSTCLVRAFAAGLRAFPSFISD